VVAKNNNQPNRNEDLTGQTSHYGGKFNEKSITSTTTEIPTTITTEIPTTTTTNCKKVNNYFLYF